MSPSVVFKVHATAAIGFGHFRRCLSMAQILKKAGYPIFLHTNRDNPLLNQEVRQIFDVCVAPEQSYVEDIILFANKNKADWIVLDGSEFDENFELKIRKMGLKLLRIVDLPNRKYDCDVLLSQNFGAENEEFKTSEGARRALGLDYVLLSQKVRGLQIKDPLGEQPFKVLVTLGGSQLVNQDLVKVFASAFTELPHDSVEIKWVGSQESAEELKKQTQSSKISIECLEFTPDIERHFVDCNVVLCSVGTTMWEMIYLTIPFIALPLTKEQDIYVEKLVRASLCKRLPAPGALKAEEITRQLLSLRMNLVDRNAIRKHQKAVLNRDQLENRILGLFH